MNLLERFTSESARLEDLIVQAKKAAQMIIEQCQPWLDSVPRGHLIYRGVKNINKTDVFVKPIRTDRLPVDSTPVVHKQMERRMQDDGCVARRTNSAFVTGNSGDASGYGTECVVYPVGKFHYTWSPDIKDGYSQGVVAIAYAEPGQALYRCDDNSLIKAIESGHEIHIASPALVYVPIDTFFKGGCDKLLEQYQ